jgi:hypothetical protein
MKPIRLILLLLTFSAVAFYACSDSDPVHQSPAAQGSIALRTAINEIKKANPSGRSVTDAPLCFQFVYPIYLGYNNGTEVTVTTYQGLLALLAQENPNFYVQSIAFPFQVEHEGAVETIADETAFTALLQDCGVNTWNADLGTSFCFDLVFPIQVMAATSPETISSQEQLASYLGNAANGTEANIVFPVSVLYNGQQMTVNDVYAFYQLINSCNTCVCSQQYEPVCVHTPVGVITYGNMCYAECAGYTQNDLVSCTPVTPCSISNLTTVPGACNGNGTYPLTINFSFSGSATDFQVTYNGVVLGTYLMSALPVTVDFPADDASAGFLTVHVSGTDGCSATQQWAIPDCGAAPANFGTALGTCFNIVFPVQVESQGALVTLNSNGDVLQYWFPNAAPIPAFAYPVTVTQTTPTGIATTTIHNQSEFLSLVNSCN